jgi:hypothetical protein
MKFSKIYCRNIWPKISWMVEGDPVKSLSLPITLPISLYLIFMYGGLGASLIGFLIFIGALIGILNLVISRIYFYRGMLEVSPIFSGDRPKEKGILIVFFLCFLSYGLKESFNKSILSFEVGANIISKSLLNFNQVWYEISYVFYSIILILLLSSTVLKTIEGFLLKLGMINKTKY